MKSEDKVLPFPTIFKGYTSNINCNQSKQLKTIIRRVFVSCLNYCNIEVSLLFVQLLNQSKWGSGC